MEQYLVSARKYRPAEFHSVVGQQHITDTLRNALKNNQVAHAFLFCGPRGIGKTTCARILAKAVNCEKLSADAEPCGTCAACVSFQNNQSFNIFELDAASNNSVDDIRGLIEQIRYAPQSGKYKVFIIDEVHMLSASAFNAFLKTLEEPPAHAIFILATTEKHKILPTILSRCQKFDFHRIRINDIVNHLQKICKQENIKAEEDALHIVAQKADGSMRDALSIFDQLTSFTNADITLQSVLENLNVLDYAYYFKIADVLFSGNVPQSLLVFDEIISLGFDGHPFINGLSEHFRNLLVSRDASTVKLLEVSETVRAKYLAQAKQFTGEFLINAINICNAVDLQYKTSHNARLLVELSLIKLCLLNEAVDLAKASVTKQKTTSPVQTVKKNSEPVKSYAPLVEEPKGEKYSAPAKSIAIPSMDELRAKVENSFSQKEKVVKEEKNSVQIDSSAFDAAWKESVKHFRLNHQDALASIIEKSSYTLNHTSVTVKTKNQFEKDYLMENRASVTDFILEKLNAKSEKPLKRLDIIAEIDETVNAAEPRKLYTADEKLKYLQEKNPLLKDLMDRFDAHISY